MVFETLKTLLCRALIEEGHRRLPWALAYLELEAAQQRTFQSPSAVAETVLAGVYAWRTADDHDALSSALDLTVEALQVTPPHFTRVLDHRV